MQAKVLKQEELSLRLRELPFGRADALIAAIEESGCRVEVRTADGTWWIIKDEQRVVMGPDKTVSEVIKLVSKP